MPVYKYLDLSTGHITEGEAEAIAASFPLIDDSGPRVIAHDYGWWVNVLDEDWADQLRRLREHYPNVAACLTKARELDCTWINFDQDAGQHDGLQIFEW